MINWVLRKNTGTITVSRNIVLSSVAEPRDTVEAQKLAYHWKWADEPDMEPQLFGVGVAGQPVAAPFDTSQDRDVIFYQTGFAEKGMPNATHPHDGEQFVYTKPTPPVLADATFSSPDVDLTFAAAGGTGTMRLLRRTGTDDFVEVANFDASTTTYSDTPPVNATYDYKLTQDGIDGDSNILSATVTGSAPAGSPPDTLAASHDGDHTSSLTWVNHGGTGTNRIERKRNSGLWTEIGTALAAATSYSDTTANPGIHAATYTYRVRNDSVTGYSNESSVFVDAI